ncbi:MAG: hypothetical protein RI907_2142, partial [Pseudomonadota bacterium]
GYAALADRDTNPDGQLTSADATWRELSVWVDGNLDGVVGAGELKSLDQLGIVSLDLTAQKGTEIDNGNLLGLVSSYTTADGSDHAMADVWFAKSSATAEAATTSADAASVTTSAVSAAQVSLSDVLAAPQDDVLAAATGSVSSATEVSTLTTSASTVSTVADLSLSIDRTKLIDDKNNDLLI